MSLSRVALALLVGLLALGLAAPSAVARAPHSTIAPAVASALAPSEAEVAAVPLPQTRTIRMGMILAIGMAPIYVARERGYFAAENLDLQYEPVQVTSEAIAQVATGNLEVANVTVGAAVLNSIQRGIDIKIISGNDGYPPEGPGAIPSSSARTCTTPA